MADDDQYQYPGLISIIPKAQMTKLETRLQVLEERTNVHSKMFFLSVQDDIAITAREVLKWAIKKRKVVDGQCLHYFDKDPEVEQMVLLACRAYGEYGPNPGSQDLTNFKEMSQIVLQACNNVAHLQGLEALENRVEMCKVAIKEWPDLKAKYPAQCKILLQYHDFKAVLPESFQ